MTEESVQQTVPTEQTPDFSHSNFDPGVLDQDTNIQPSQSPVQMLQEDMTQKSEQQLKEQMASWKDMLNDDLKNNEIVKEATNLNEVLDNLLKASNSDLQLPKDISEYDWKAPEGIASNDKIDTEFKNFALEIGLKPDQFSKLNQFVYDKSQELSGELDPAAFEQKMIEERDASQRELEKEWGTQFDSRIEKIKYAIVEAFGDNGLEYVSEKGLANDVPFMKMMAKYSDFITEDSFHQGGNSTNLESINAQINEILHDNKSAYFDQSHPSHKQMVSDVHNLYIKKMQLEG